MQIEDVFRKLRPIMGPQLDALWQEYLVGDPTIRKTIEQTLRVMLAQRLNETFENENVLLKPPPKDLAAGEYPVGMIHYGKGAFYQFGLREDEFIQHIGIFGRSGSGKTNLAYLLLHSLTRTGKPFLIFDWKRNYRDLIGMPRFNDLIIFTVGRDVTPFRFNPLIPPHGTPAKVWLKKLIEIMGHAYFLGEGVSILLLRAIDSLYRDCGLYGNNPDRYPTMADVRDFLQNYKPKNREASWMVSAIRAVETLCFGEMGSALNDSRPFDVKSLLDKNVVLELDALTNADKIFLIESLLLWIHHYRLNEKNRENFKHCIIIEEAHHILLRKKTETTGEESVTDVILREIRELGESIIVLDQHPSLISKPALGNTFATFVFNLKHRSDTAMIQDSLHLDTEQARYLSRLDIGWCIVRLAGRWHFPFLVKIPLIRIRKGNVSDDDIKRQNEGLIKSSITAYKPDSSLPRTQDRWIPPVPDYDKQEDNGENSQDKIQLTTQDFRFMADIVKYPHSSILERYARISLTRRKGNEVQNSLINHNFISSSFIRYNKRTLKLLTLTSRGRKALGMEGNETRKYGSSEHRFWVEKIAEKLRKQGYKVTIEAPIGKGKTIDILAERNGERKAFEIETGKSDVEGNIRKCLKAGFEKITIVATNSNVKNSALSKIQLMYPKVKIIDAGTIDSPHAIT